MELTSPWPLKALGEISNNHLKITTERGSSRQESDESLADSNCETLQELDRNETGCQICRRDFQSLDSRGGCSTCAEFFLAKSVQTMTASGLCTVRIATKGQFLDSSSKDNSHSHLPAPFPWKLLPYKGQSVPLRIYSTYQLITLMWPSIHAR